MTTPANLHLEIQSHRKHHYGLIRSSFRRDGKVQHTSHGRLSGLPLEKLKLIQAAFRGQVVRSDSPETFQILASREYGASQALLQLARELALPQVLYSRKEAWVGPALAMIIGRIVYAGSKLALAHQAPNTALWELCGVDGKIDVDQHCYAVMDRLLERQPAIQRALAKKHLQNGHLVLYDITSSYLEGEYETSEIVAFGYNRDGKRGHEQVVIGLLCNEQGCPVGVEVFPGNTQDASTVPAKIAQLQNDYGLSELIFVGDRGMITQANQRKLQGVAGWQTISALPHRQLVELLQRVGRVLQRYKMGKFVHWSDGKLEWHFDQEKIQAEERFDGCYVVVADVPPDKMAKAQVVASYKKLSLVEDAFRNLKTVQLEVRPVYHKKDDRIRAHVFLCMLAYYLQWHAQARLQPLFDKDGQGKDRQWTFASVIQRLSALRSNRVQSAGVEFSLITQAEADQQAILECLSRKPPVAINLK